MNLSRRRCRATTTIILGGTLWISQNSFAQIERPGSQRDPSQSHPAAEWLLQSAHPVKTLVPENSDQDLQPLQSILRDVNIVGLGEGSHGTREFIQLKHRLVEFLVKNVGYTLLVTELSYATSLAINDYVLNENGAANLDVIKRPWPMDTEEWNALIEWMREYNKSVPGNRKVRFLGYDTKPTSEVLELVTSYLRRVSPDHVEFAKSALHPVLDELMPELDLAVTLPHNGRRPQRSEEAE